MADTEEKHFGFICELNEDVVKVFDWKNQLVEFPNLDYDYEIGDWVFSTANELEWDSSPTDAIKVFVENDEVFVKTPACTPNEMALSKFLRQKYLKTSWSPWLQILNDPSDIFASNAGTDLVAMVTVKYAPKDGRLFEIVDVEALPPNVFEFDLGDAPWNQELLLLQSSWTSNPYPSNSLPSLLRSNFRAALTTPINKGFGFTGVCFANNLDNVFFKCKNPNYLAGSKMSFVFCWELGTVRYLQNDFEMEIGKWYRFFTNDKRLKVKDNKSVHFIAATVTKPKEIAVELIKSYEVGGIFEAETELFFCHNGLESEENRKITDWDERRKGLSLTASFNNFYLGRIEIYPKHCEQIIRKIEDHREQLSPEERENMKDESIVVTVKIQLLKKWDMYVQNPNKSIFLVSDIVAIHYAIGGAKIYQKDE